MGEVGPPLIDACTWTTRSIAFTLGEWQGKIAFVLRLLAARIHAMLKGHALNAAD
jgi:hypothetical protein